MDERSKSPTDPLGGLPDPDAGSKPSAIPRPDLAKKYSRMAFIERNFVWVKRIVYVVIGILFFIIAFQVGSAIIRAVLPKQEVVVPVDPSTIPPSDFSQITFDTPVLVTTGERTYDVVFRISDANKQWGVNKLQYRVNVLSAAGTLLKSQTGTRFALPGSSVTVIVSNITTSEVAASATVERLAGDFAKPVTTEPLSVEVRSRHFSPKTSDGIATFSGVLRNNSNYDLDRVDIQMLVKNTAGQIIGINFTQANTVKSNEDRAFVLNFDRTFDDTVTYDIVVTTNALERSNFLLKQGKPIEF